MNWGLVGVAAGLLVALAAAVWEWWLTRHVDTTGANWLAAAGFFVAIVAAVTGRVITFDRPYCQEHRTPLECFFCMKEEREKECLE